MKKAKQFVDSLNGKKEVKVEYGGSCHALVISPKLQSEGLTKKGNRRKPTVNLHLSLPEARKLADHIQKVIHISEQGSEIKDDPQRGYRSICVPITKILITGHPESGQITVLGR